MTMTPKENYLRMLSGEIPEFIPSYIIPHSTHVAEELLTPQAAPNGPYVTSLGVTYVGSPDFNYGAMPEPNHIIISDITKWDEQLKIRDVSGRDWESYYRKQSENFDRENKCVGIGGGDYFLTLVSLMGFEGALLAMYEEPDEVISLLEFISKFYTTVLKNQLYYTKPDLYNIMDDDSGQQAPFFSLAMYRKIFKPFHKLHADLAREAGCIVERHDCGKSEQFVDDWIEIGIRSWNPAQIVNDCKAIKKKYVGKLALSGCWDQQYWTGRKATEKELKDALAEYVDTFAPCGSFTFSAMMGGPTDDPATNENRAIARQFYFDYVKDWYKTHSV